MAAAAAADATAVASVGCSGDDGGLDGGFCFIVYHHCIKDRK